MNEYEAMLSRPDNIARVHAAKREIERAGGTISILQQSATGMVMVVLKLPPARHPEEFLPGLPFYPI